MPVSVSTKHLKAAASGQGHNGGPPLEEAAHTPEWGKGDPGNYFLWRNAHRAVWKTPSRETKLRRMEKADSIGLTYEEYTLEILERGRYLQIEDVEAIAAIKAKRRQRHGKRHLPY
jgi:hypothetical protein